MRALLDVNMLLALFDHAHIYHARALEWWGANREAGWASSPLTQNGFVRIVTQLGYARPARMSDAMRVLTGQIGKPDHEFWPDDISITDAVAFDHSRILGPKQITDIYLLALAVKRSGRLVTFDRGLPLKAVRGAEPRHLVVL